MTHKESDSNIDNLKLCNLNKNKNHSYEWSNKNNFEKGPPDIEEIFHKIINKLNSFFNKKQKNNFNKPKNTIYYYTGILIFSTFIIWIGSGFYTIKEAERGVVLRFGKFNNLVEPGLNWMPSFIDTVTPVNVESVRELVASGTMLTSDENVINVEMNIQYRITNPKKYLFSATNADDSLHQATDSALRGVIGKYTMGRILTEGRTLVRNDTHRILEEIIKPYNMGITLLDVNFQAARPPEEVKESFDDAIAARENEQQFIREAEAYSNEVLPRANGKARRILEEGRAYKTRTILEAQGEVQRFAKVLPEYKSAPKITLERIYIDTIEHILSNTHKILINSNSLIVLPLDSLLQKQIISKHKNNFNNKNKKLYIDKNISSSPIEISLIKNKYNKKNIDNYHYNIYRSNITREEKR